ncbi:MAG: FkbM family methyltransferase [Terracidiphilus sp.]
MSSRPSFHSAPDPKSFIGQVVRLPLRLVPNNRTVRVLSGVNKGSRWITGSGPTHGCWLGNYERDHAVTLPRLIKPGTIAYDIGANVGFYTLALSRLVGESGHVFAFEPAARSVYFLRRHLELNNIRNVTVVQTAIADRTGLVTFDGWRMGTEKSYVVPTMSLDEFIAAGHPLPSFVKMDIEGVEKLALEGAKRLLSKGDIIWLLATHSNLLRDQCRALMEGYGYHFECFDSPEDPEDRADFLAIPSPAVASRVETAKAPSTAVRG